LAQASSSRLVELASAFLGREGSVETVRAWRRKLGLQELRTVP
jgi:hypothetical protein